MLKITFKKILSLCFKTVRTRDYVLELLKLATNAYEMFQLVTNTLVPFQFVKCAAHAFNTLDILVSDVDNAIAIPLVTSCARQQRSYS